MKNTLIIICIFILVFSMCSCSDIYEETTISDIELYETIWNLPERRVAESSLLFPSTVDKETVEYFNCKHTTYQLLGTG